MRKIAKTTLLLLVTCQAIVLSAGNPVVYFRENFKKYKETAPTCVTDIGIRANNDPIWTNSASITCNLSKSSTILKKFVPLPDKLNVQVLFKFRIKDAEAKFNLVFRNAKKQTLPIQFSATTVSISSKLFNVSAKAEYAGKFSKKEWREAAVTINDGVLTVSVNQNRVFQQVLKVKIPKIKLVSANFFGFKKAPFDLADIMFRQPASLPDYSITRLLPISKKVKTGTPGPLKQTWQVADRFGGSIKVGTGSKAAKLKINFTDQAKPIELAFTAKAIQANRRVEKNGKKVNEKYNILDDAFIEITANNGRLINYYVRPMLTRYKTSYSVTDVYRDIIRDQAMLPKASAHPLKVEFKKTADGINLFLGGSYAKAFKGNIKNIELSLADGAELVDTYSTKNQYDVSKYTLLDIPAQGMAKTTANGTSSLKKGLQNVDSIPMIVADGASAADIGLTKQGQGSWALEVDEYLRRSPFDGLLTEVHFRVPARPYHAAYVLCAVDPDPTKDPILTTRITQYKGAGIGNNCLADTQTVFSHTNEPLKENMKVVGSVKLNGKDIPLYLVKVPLNIGKVIDLAMRAEANAPDYLNIDFFGKPSQNFEQIDRTSKPDPDSTSAIQIFGVTLVNSTVGMLFEQAQPSNVFHNDEKPATTVVLKSFAPASGKLVWVIRDKDGKKVNSGAEAFKFTKAGQEKKIRLDLAVKKLGWYGLNFDIYDAKGKKLLSHTGSMAVLGRDERQATLDSPYGTWWFAGTHLTPRKLDFGGPVLKKAGIRKVAWVNNSEEEMKPWGLTKDQIVTPIKFRDLKRIADSKDPVKEKEKLFAAVKKKTDALLKRYPNIRCVLIFHESGPNNIPAEVVGIKPQLTEKQRKREKRYADLLNLAGEFYRKYYPNLKLMVGNSSSSAPIIAAIIRHGGNVDLIDFIGIETPSQVIIPEKFQEFGLQGLRMSMETAKVLSGKDIPADGCYEFTYRCERDMGEQQQAEWYVRDTLISLAADFKRIGPGLLYDTANSYYNGLWGGSGIMRRAPYGYPKKSYVAYAVLTNALDRVTFNRQIPTGSTTVYAIEFDRADGKKAYAFWSSRGSAKLHVKFDGTTRGKIVEMYGNSQQFDSKEILVNASTAPGYVICNKPVKSIDIMSRSFPKDMAKARKAKVAASLANSESIQVISDSSLETDLNASSFKTPILKQGTVSIATVEDNEKGSCVEVTLDKTKTPKLNKYITEYVYLKLKEPKAIESDPVAMGVWVKGNSNWGRIMFELVDAEGEVWRSIGTGGWGCDILDWPGNIAVNFDGWNFVALPLRKTKLFNDHSPGPVEEQWVSNGKGDKKMTLPLKLNGLIIEMNRTPIDLVDFKEVSNSIRLKNAGGVYEE